MIIERIKQYLDYRHISVSVFEKSVGMSNASFGKSLKNKGAIGTDKLENILNVYSELSSEWLLTGRGNMLTKENTPMPSQIKVTPETVLKKTLCSTVGRGIPLIPIAAVAGFLSVDEPGVRIDDCPCYFVPEFQEKGAEFMIRVSGNSMEPLYDNGDVLACRKVRDIFFFQWGNVYVMDTSQGSLVKHVYEDKDNGDRILCVSENASLYPPYSIPKSDIRSLSTVVGLIRLV